MLTTKKIERNSVVVVVVRGGSAVKRWERMAKMLILE